MLNRRTFLKIGTATVAAAPLANSQEALAHSEDLAEHGGVDYSHLTGLERQAVATACGLCASRCAAIGYVEKGYVVKIEGQPRSIRTAGRLCAKGQAGINQIYDPDRILHPLKRVGKRGEGKWEKISWDEALSALAGRLKKLRDEGHPEKFMFHHGWISASADRLINKVFLASYGTGSIASNSCLGQSARQTAQELTWGGREDSWDFDNTRFVLNFGSNVLEAHTNHVALARRLADGLALRNLKVVTFDVRLSNTGAKSHTWIQIKPGGDFAVILAMCNVVMSEDLYRGAGEEFLKFCQVTKDRQASTQDKIAALKAHLAQYTPEWAQEISGVSADLITDIAIEFATTNPACVISSRGASANYNGVETERAIQMLAAITGNIDNPGGRCRGVSAQWNYPSGPKNKPEPRALDILAGFEGEAALPVNGLGHQVLNLIKDGRGGRPDIYMWYNYNPVFSNGNTSANAKILKDVALIPFTVAVTPFYDESAALADLILPDATYLEKFDFEDGISPSQIPEFYIRQPVVAPQGEARDFKNVCIDLANRMGFPLGFDSAEKFVEESCKLTPEVKKKAGGFRKMKKRGVWHDPKGKPLYHSYKTPAETQTLYQAEVIFDEETGVYWNWKTAGLRDVGEALSQGYRRARGAHKGYIAQKIGEETYTGFKPYRLNKSGFFELYSAILEAKGLAPLPSYRPIPEHQAMAAEELILTTFRINVQTLSRTQNCMWLDEIDVDQSAWINPVTAEAKSIGDGDRIKIKSPIGEIEVLAKVTENVVPGVVAISSHGGRWEYGRYASGKKAPNSID
ncbi:MAG: molybdopterin-containing oxidoreductase family protein, partial [Alphaproteobacteria bacterium]